MVNKLNTLYLKNLSITREVFCLCLLMIQVVSYAQANLKVADAKKSFGFVKKGEVVKIMYTFTNTGNQPLVITDTKAECSCTSIDFPKQPITPGQTNTITVSFDTKSVYDRQDRTVEIVSNAKNGVQKIRFKGVVLK